MTDSQLYLGINDDFTARYASSCLGNTTIETEGISRKKEGLFSGDSTNENLNYTQRKLVFADECKRFENQKLILSQRAYYPTQLYKVQYRYWEEASRICKSKKVEELKNLKEDKDIDIDSGDFSSMDKSLYKDEISAEKVLREA